MNYIDIPNSHSETVAFYLAAEEYVARKRKEDDCFFMWQVNPSVIFGRNQLIENEVNIDYCKAHHIQIFRRKSGGGCVYADRNNIMMSYINTGNGVQFVFDRFIRLIAALLGKLGIAALKSSRNDILIDGRKVSGNAFYHLPGRNIVHGTMLYDTDMENMVGSITPSDQKLLSKGVKSVRQHITLLKDYIQLSLEEFKKFVRETLCEETITLSPSEIEEIKTIETEYTSEKFIYGHNPRYTIRKEKHIEDCGHFDVRLEIKNSIIQDIDLTGDFFVCGDLTFLLQRLKGVAYQEEAVREAMKGIKIEEFILKLNTNHLIELLF